MLLTFKLAFWTTLILLPIGILLGFFLYRAKNVWKICIEVLIWLPLVLPPTVLGFYLLILFSPNGFLGKFLLAHWDLKLVFSFEGILIASVIFGLPFMVNPIKSGLQSLPPQLEEASFMLGRGRMETLFLVLLPNIKPSILLACMGTFVHAIGEFGVVMMIGGNIQGETRLASIALYDEVEALNYALAHQYALSLFAVSAGLLFVILWINKRYLETH
ncbi:molybdate ABC transporter permease subunit [Helicobacter pametensis]|uniref:molybdate ABC transporter permease subunit n=1 Tax=Helicobacter pametensis TaxID=95149 RepID=UPI000555F784|nr:molybdate ABC transporter permease subunit [Helicobacter pametensis]